MAALSYPHWRRLYKAYLPVSNGDDLWRYSRRTKPGEPTQGWKLHVSATVLQACLVFERVAPFLTSRGTRFKATSSLEKLVDLNSGLKYGYAQIGKFITVYPSTESEAVEIAQALHELTCGCISVKPPFDERFRPGSLVSYRYGAFSETETIDIKGVKMPAVRNRSGTLVPDDRLNAVPEWIHDPFQQKNGACAEIPDASPTPLMDTYKVFKAITQRGKGGTYLAVDLSRSEPTLCIVKEGRRHGEVGWNGQDGYELVMNECGVLQILRGAFDGVPQVYSSFDASGNFYVAMEFVHGKSLYDLMKIRRRRFAVKQALAYSIEIARLIEEIGNAGWVWNDCKPSNVIVTKGGNLRPIDFENAYRINEQPSFRWNSKRFSKPGIHGPASDLYALGATIYFMLTGRIYDPNDPVPIHRLRSSVPIEFALVTTSLLERSEEITVRGIRRKLATLI